jgi:hypothetical protein
MGFIAPWRHPTVELTHSLALKRVDITGIMASA